MGSIKFFSSEYIILSLNQSFFAMFFFFLQYIMLSMNQTLFASFFLPRAINRTFQHFHRNYSLFTFFPYNKLVPNRLHQLLQSVSFLSFVLTHDSLHDSHKNVTKLYALFRNIFLTMTRAANETARYWSAVVTHLIYEGSEAVVEGLDLVFLLCADGLDGGVDLQVQRGQEALVDCHCCDGGHKPTTVSHTETHATSVGCGATETHATSVGCGAADVAPTSQATLDSSIGAARCVTLSAHAGAWVGEAAEATWCSCRGGGFHNVGCFLRDWHCACRSSALKWLCRREWE